MSKKSIRHNVEKILGSYPETRNDDKKLILKYWQLYDKIPMDNIESFKLGFINSSTSTESIRRARQLIQEEGKFLPTDEMVAIRRWKKSKMENAIKEREVV